MLEVGLGGEGRGWEGAFGGGASRRLGGASRAGRGFEGRGFGSGAGRAGRSTVSFPRFLQRVLCGLGFAPGAGWRNGSVVVGQDGKGGDIF